MTENKLTIGGVKVVAVPGLPSDVMIVQEQIDAIPPRMADVHGHMYFCDGPVADAAVCNECGGPGVMPGSEWYIGGEND